MMRKWIAIAVTGSLLMSILCGCGTSSQKENETKEEKTTGVSEVVVAENTDAATTNTEETADDVAATPEIGGEAGMQSQTSAYTRVWGPVLAVDQQSITIDNRSDNGSRGEMILLLDPERTKILDGEDATPEELTEIEVNDGVFAYIGNTATMSLPPQATAEVVFCDPSDDLRIPEFILVEQMEQQDDGSYLLVTDGNTRYMVPQTCEIVPYLTRNLVTAADITQGSTCIVWSDERLTAKKIMLFAE